MFEFLIAALLQLCPLVSCQARAPQDAGDLSKLQGHWKPVDIKGNETPQKPVLITKEDVIKHLRITFQGNELITAFGDSISREPFQVQPAGQPKAIDVTRTVMPPMAFLRAGEKPGPLPPPKTEIVKGIYELEGDTLKVCLPLSAKSERPKSFEAALAAGHSILVLTKDNDKRASARLNDAQLLGELRRLGVDAFSSGDHRDSGSVYVRITQDADRLIERIGPTLRKLSYVTGLHLHDSGVTDAGLAHLKDINNIGHINLSQTNVSDAGLVHLAGMTKLRLIILNGTKVTDEGIARLKKALPNLDVEKLSKRMIDAEKAIQNAGGVLFTGRGVINYLAIEITKNPGFTDKELKQLEPHLEVWKDSLTRISLAGTGVTDIGLKSLYQLKNLKQLDVTGTKVSKEGAADLKRQIPGLRVVTTGD